MNNFDSFNMLKHVHVSSLQALPALPECCTNIHTNFLLYPLAYYITYMHLFQPVIGISTIPLCVHVCFVLLCCWLRLPTSNKRTCYVMLCTDSTALAYHTRPAAN